MPAMAGIHDLLCWHEGKSWIPAFAGMTGWVSAESRSFGYPVSHAEFRTLLPGWDDDSEAFIDTIELKASP
jgi:hypothetical protein